MAALETDRDPLSRSQDILPTSQYLQEKLQERRARNTRPHRSRHTDFGPRPGRDDDIFLHEAEAARAIKPFESSPLAYRPKDQDASASSSSSRRRALGVRDMDTQLDRLNKQNFALKLELDHRREQTMKLQDQIESMRAQFDRAERLEEEHAELLKINTQLVEELEKRDRAVEEAMDIICDLEEKVSDLEERSSVTRPSTAHADSGYAGTDTQEQVPPSSPPGQTTPKTPYINIRQASQPASAASARLQGVLNDRSPAKTKREPSILSQKKASTAALRSVYLASADQLHPVKSFQSLLSKHDSKADDASIDDVLNSPRLSVLSESSFPSIYSPKKQFSPDRYPWEESQDDLLSASASRPRAHLRQDSIKRVSQWISERDLAEGTPSKSNQISQPLPDVAASSISASKRAAGDTHFQSLNDALTTANGATNTKSKPSKNVHPPGPRDDSADIKRSRARPTSFAGPMFGEPLLPPTPDSASTRLLRASRSSIIDERSLLDTTPVTIKGYDALAPTVRSAPRPKVGSTKLNGQPQRPSTHFGFGRHNHFDYSSDEDDEHDARLNPLAHFDDEYDGYPDGKSLLMGTPSRFLKHPKPALGDVTFDGYDSPFVPTVRSPPRRRQSSAGHSTITPAKPHLSRLETSPNVFASLGRMVGSAGSKTAVESVVSPRSVHSGSSGNRTIIPSDEHPLPLPPSPELTRSKPHTHSRTSPSPARTLTQKTQSLFRRLSNSQGSDRPEPPPALPTLTSTPSSAYVNTVPIDQRRPKTSESTPKIPGTTLNFPPSHPSGARRPSIPSRTKTDPPARSASAVPADEKEKKTGLFKRSNSVKKVSNAEAEAAISGDGGLPVTRSRSRRGSIRDAVAGTGRRPWKG